jgi:hypothetical protein
LTVDKLYYVGLEVGEKRNVYRILEGKPEDKQPLGRPRRKWLDNIKMHLRELGWVAIYWIDLTHDRDLWGALVNIVINIRFP